MSKLIILDRDGVINQDSVDYIKTPDEFLMLPGSAEAIALLTQAGYVIAVATNQSGVSRGYYDREMLDAIHDKMRACVERAGGRIDLIESCIHLPSAQCACRKPKPGLLYAIAQRLQCDLQDVPFVGDRVSDVQAAMAVGARPFMVISTMTDETDRQMYPQVPVFLSLLDCVHSILG